VSAI
jgi:hypothetical protein